MDPLSQILIGLSEQELARLLGITTDMRNVSREPSIFATNTAVQEILALLEDGTFGLAALHAQIATLTATLGLDVTALLTAIGTPQQTGSPATLPATLPGGAGYVSDANVGSLVWGYGILPITLTAAQLLSYAGGMAQLDGGNGATPLTASPYFVAHNVTAASIGDFNPSNYPQPDVGAILPTDTLQTWLTRELAGWTIHPGYWGGTAIEVDPPFATPLFYTCQLDDRSFDLLKAAVLPPLVIPPTWPGLALVTLGTPVALDTTVTIVTPCDGCLVSITGVPAKQGRFNIGDAISWRNAGAVAFTSDNGQEEYPQLLGLADAVYCARSMAHAAGLVLRASPGFTGTVTPWSVT